MGGGAFAFPGFRAGLVSSNVTAEVRMTRCAIVIVALLAQGCQSPCTWSGGRADGVDDGQECALMERFGDHCGAFDPEDGGYGEGYLVSFCNNADETCHEDPDVDEFCGDIDNSS